MNLDLGPLIQAFARDATPLNVALVFFSAVFGALFWLADRESRRRVRILEDRIIGLTDKLLEHGKESVKAGLAVAAAIDANADELRENRQALQAILPVIRELDAIQRRNRRS